MAFGFFPGMPLGDPSFAEFGGLAGGAPTPTVVLCELAIATVVGLPATIGIGMAINCTPAVANLVGLPASIIAPTTITCTTALATVEGLAATISLVSPPAPPSAEGLFCTISFEGIDETIPVYDVGDAVAILALFYDPITEVPTNPSGLAFRIKNPSGVITTSIVPEYISAGLYKVVQTANASGQWRFNFSGTGVSEEGEFLVSSSLSDAS